MLKCQLHTIKFIIVLKSQLHTLEFIIVFKCQLHTIKFIIVSKSQLHTIEFIIVLKSQLHVLLKLYFVQNKIKSKVEQTNTAKFYITFNSSKYIIGFNETSYLRFLSIWKTSAKLLPPSMFLLVSQGRYLNLLSFPMVLSNLAFLVGR